MHRERGASVVRKGSSVRTKFILCLVGIIPVIWLALLMAPYMDEGIPGVIKHINEITQAPLTITLCENSRKTVLALLLVYVMVLAVYFSNDRNYRHREEHGSAKWGIPERLNRRYRHKDPFYSKILTQNVCADLRRLRCR